MNVAVQSLGLHHTYMVACHFARVLEEILLKRSFCPSSRRCMRLNCLFIVVNPRPFATGTGTDIGIRTPHFPISFLSQIWRRYEQSICV